MTLSLEVSRLVGLMLIPWVGVSLQDWVFLVRRWQSLLGESVLMESCWVVTTCPPDLLSQMFFGTTCMRK